MHKSSNNFSTTKKWYNRDHKNRWYNDGCYIERNRDFKFLTNKELLEQAKINSKNRELLCRRHLIYLLSKWLLPEKLT